MRKTLIVGLVVLLALALASGVFAASKKPANAKCDVYCKAKTAGKAVGAKPAAKTPANAKCDAYCKAAAAGKAVGPRPTAKQPANTKCDAYCKGAAAGKAVGSRPVAKKPMDAKCDAYCKGAAAGKAVGPKPLPKAGGKKVSAVCPVMGTEIADVSKASGKSVYKGKTYYFCCPGCKPQFDANPEKYIKKK